MRNEYIINLNDMNKLRQFTMDVLYKIDSHIDAIYGKQCVDAKSLLGLVTLANHDIKVVMHSDNEKELELFKNICERYEVK